MSGKLTQEEIDRLANEDDSDGEAYQQKIEEAYEDQFDKEPAQQFEEDFEPEVSQNASKHTPIHDVSEVKSEMQESNNEINEEMGEEIGQSVVQSLGEFKKDEDLSLAKSQFIQSSNLNNLQVDSKIKNKQAQKTKNTEIQRTKTTKNQSKSAKVDKQLKPKKQQGKPKVSQDPKSEKKPKLSESQIKERMKAVQQEKDRLQKIKQEKQQKEDDQKRKQYEEAKKLEEERKQKNRKILEQQKKKPKKGTSQIVTKHEMKFEEGQVKLPEKRTDFTYTNMVKERKQMEKNIQKQIEQDNKNKLKKLQQNPRSQLKGQARKAQFLAERKVQLERQKKMKHEEVKEQDVLVVKKIKKQINEAKQFNKEKIDQIHRAEKTLEDITRKFKNRQKQYFSKYANDLQQGQGVVYHNISELTPIEKFVASVPQAKNSDEIFKLIDNNGDGVLSSEEIKEKLMEYKLEEDVIKKVEEILDQNSDGTVSHQEFIFLVDRQLKKQKDYRQIMGTLEVNDPLDLQAKIVDMQAKMKYIDVQIDKQTRKNKGSQEYQAKIDKLQKKAKKLENDWRKQHELAQQGNTADTANTTAQLANEAVKLKNEKNMKKQFLDKLRIKIKDNLKEKTKLLASRVEQNLRLEQEIFKIRNEIQEKELRYMSMKKIQQNKKGYFERQSQKLKEMEEAYKKTKQYKISIADPSKQTQLTAERDQMRLLAAVLMIQRNYRRRKARGQFLKMKAGKQ